MYPEFDSPPESTIDRQVATAQAVSLVIAGFALGGAGLAHVAELPALMVAFVVVALLFGFSAALCLGFQALDG